MSRIMRVSWILMPGNFAVPTVMGNASRCRWRENAHDTRRDPAGRDAAKAHWQRWGPYLSERAWGTDHSRSRAYRWNEDGIADGRPAQSQGPRPKGVINCNALP